MVAQSEVANGGGGNLVSVRGTLHMHRMMGKRWWDQWTRETLFVRRSWWKCLWVSWYKQCAYIHMYVYMYVVYIRDIV